MKATGVAMIIKRVIYIASALCICVNLHAQNIKIDSAKVNAAFNRTTNVVPAKSLIVPALLIKTGALGISGEFIISNPEIKEERDEYFSSFHTNIDNYLQFAPIATG